MRYKFLSQDQRIVGIIDDDDLIRVSFIAGGSEQIHREFNDWLAEGNTPEPPDPEPIFEDWGSFVQGLYASTLKTEIRTLAGSSLAASARANELRSLLFSAIRGMVFQEDIEELFNQLYPNLSSQAQSDLQNLITTNNIPITVSGA